MAENANIVWADGPAGSPSQPDKARIRAWGTWLESFLTAIGANSGSVYATRAALLGDLAHAANTMAWVVDDDTAAYNGIYQKSGGSGSGSWTRLADLPYSFIAATDAGAGSPNAIQATTAVPVSESALVTLNVFEANTASPVTVSFNGGSALTMKTNTGNDVAAGGLSAGMRLLGTVSGSTFRLISDQVSSAIVAAAEAYAVAALASQIAAGNSETNAAASEGLAEKWANEAEDVVVFGGLYSAFHWAQKAAAVVTGGIADAFHAATGKTAIADADEFGLADSAATWGLKKVTLANLISSIFKTSRTIANAQFAATTFKLFNAAGTPRALTITATALTADRAITMPDANIDLANAVPQIGWGKVVTGGLTRTANVAYQNTGTRPLMAFVIIGSGSSQTIDVSPNGSTWTNVYDHSGGASRAAASVLVPQGWYYRSNTTSVLWTEIS